MSMALVELSVNTVQPYTHSPFSPSFGVGVVDDGSSMAYKYAPSPSVSVSWFVVRGSRIVF